MNLESDFRELTCRILDEQVDPSELQRLSSRPEWLASVQGEGLSPILHFQLQKLGLSSHLPPESAARIKSDYLGQTFIEEIRLDSMRPFLAETSSAGIRCLALKGTALAYSIYPEPCLRVRTDTDLLISEGDRLRLDEILNRHRFLPATRLPGELGQYQQSYWRELAPGVEQLFDVHWKVSNVEVVSNFLRLDELWERSRPEPRLGTRIPSLVDSLLLACVHRVAHHNRSRAVLWLYDIHLLSRALSAPDREEFRERAHELGVSEICRNSLSATLEEFPAEPTHRLAELLLRGRLKPEDSQLLLLDHRPIDLLWMNFRRLPGWRARVRWIREQLFPPRSYLYQRYGKRGVFGTCLLYLKRIGKGTAEFLNSKTRG